MTDGLMGIPAQYSDGGVRTRIEQALREAGKDPERLDAYDLALMEDFHSSGRFATFELIRLAGVGRDDRVLDAGTGIGGTARLLAHEIGCRVDAVDITPEFCEIAQWLDESVGLAEKISVREADVLDLPYDDASFDVVISQHVQMNIADKQALYAESRRVLKAGGRLALWDITAGPEQPTIFPVPWADSPELSHLSTPEALREILESTGFAVSTWNDLSEAAAEFMTTVNAAEPPPVGIHLLVPDIAVKGPNIVANIRENRLRLIQCVALAR